MMCSDIIIQKIKQEGPIPFHDFMDIALYHPRTGYYTSGKNRIGKRGDYYTSPYATSIFGEMIARQLEEMWCLLDKKPFTVIEYGGGTGILSIDILEYLKNNSELYNDLNYYIVEKNASMHDKDQSIFYGKVSWLESIVDIPVINGCVISNELVDNFAVHVVVMLEELMEVFVDYTDSDGFVEVLRPAPEKLRNYLNHLNIVLPKGFRTEINIKAIEWIREVSNCLNNGFVLTIDYDYPAAELYSGNRSSGTLLCYHKHKINDNPYINVGEQDITAHVNFSALRYWGEKFGLACCGFTGQGHFLHGIGLVDCLRQKESVVPSSGAEATTTLQLYNFFMGLGNKIKVLVQRKGVAPKMLSGLRFSQSYV